MDFDNFRQNFIEADKGITLEEYRHLSATELEDLINDAKLSRKLAGQARVYYASRSSKSI
jgi:hypothetical protein